MTEKMSSKVVIRNARREDCAEISRLIRELASFEKMPDSPRVTVEVLERDGFELKNPLYHSFVAVDPDQQNDEQPTKLVGYVIFYYGYSTWNGKKLYLEDIMVTESHRGKGIGKALFQKVCQTAAKENCEVMAFTVLKWNPAANFYKSFGAKDLTDSEEWHFYTLEKKDFYKAARVTEL